MNKVIIVGAGASGMMAAIAAARQGAEVILLEGEAIPGRKILATGNGKCNYTNEYMQECCFRGDRGNLVPMVLKQFSEKHTLTFFKELGVLPVIKNGYVYPMSGQAQTIQEVLLSEIRETSNITLLTGAKVTNILYESNLQAAGDRKKCFQVLVEEVSFGTKIFKGDRVILACGSKAASHFGSDGMGYGLAKKFGHHVVSIVPALVQLRAEGYFLKQWAGVRCGACVQLLIDGKEVCADTGEVQLTDYGISGIPVFQVSRYAAYGLKEGKKVQAVLSFIPEYEKEEVITLLQQRQERYPNRNCRQLLTGMLHNKLIPVVLDLAGIEKMNVISKNSQDGGKKKKEKRANTPITWTKDLQSGQSIGSLSKRELEVLAQVLTKFVIPITGINDFEQAQICAGGVDTAQVTAHMESKLVKGLYFAGELLDVDGMCGGYNLQWAWSTGWIAGKAAGTKS